MEQRDLQLFLKRTDFVTQSGFAQADTERRAPKVSMFSNRERKADRGQVETASAFRLSNAVIFQGGDTGYGVAGRNALQTLI